MNRRIAFIATLVLMALVPTASATFPTMGKSHLPIQINYHSGDTIEFTVVLSVRTVEFGPTISIMDLKINDTLPEGLTYVPASQTSVPAPVNFTDNGNGTLIWDYGAGPFTSDPHVTITFEVTVDDDAPRGTTRTNEATAFYTETVSQVQSSPAASDSILISEPSISLVKECQVSSNMAPANITYTYTVENTGDSDLFNVTVYDETLALTVLGPIDLAMGQDALDNYTLFNKSEGTYTNNATATGFDEGGHEVTASDSTTCRISTMVGGVIVEAVSKRTRRYIEVAFYSLIGLVSYVMVRRFT